tara:strand:+ start:277 stop:531 length:255 start_codon:yes stop_codon:yes gene_type:complete
MTIKDKINQNWDEDDFKEFLLDFQNMNDDELKKLYSMLQGMLENRMLLSQAQQERIDAEKSLNSAKDEYHKLFGVDCKPKKEIK